MMGDSSGPLPSQSRLGYQSIGSALQEARGLCLAVKALWAMSLDSGQSSASAPMSAKVQSPSLNATGDQRHDSDPRATAGDAI
jgi:hypothetical protein